MDQNSIPPTDHEAIAWYKAIGGFLLGLVVALIAHIWTKHEGKEETQEIDHKRRAEDHFRRITELEIRIVRIESKEALSRTDLYDIVHEVLDEVTARFKADHESIVKKVESCAVSINGRVDDLVLAIANKGQK